MSRHRAEPLRGVDLSALSWLSGRWLTEDADGRLEEHWMAPDGAMLLGMFRWTVGAEVKFTEIMSVERDAEGLVFRIKHFHPGMKGWEEKDESVEFDLTEVGGRRSVWARRNSAEEQWMIYEVDSAGDLTAWFEKPDTLPSEDGKFRMHPAR